MNCIEKSRPVVADRVFAPPFAARTSQSYTCCLTVKEIESAIGRLSPTELAELAQWFDEHHESAWDQQIADDARSGRLGRLIDEAEREFKSGRCKPL